MKQQKTKVIRVLSVRRNPAGLKPIESISDRAKRYRANRPGVRPGGPEVCGYCGSTRSIGVDHVDGNEANENPANLLKACKSCNALKAHVLKRAGLGRRVVQANPPRKRGGLTVREYGNAVKVMRGIYDGDVAAAVATVQSAPASVRSAYTRSTWAARRALNGPTGRKPGKYAQMDIPF